MAFRALIIAIEEYRQASAGMLANSLPGTLQAGITFRDWLDEKWKSEGRKPGEVQVLFCSEPRVSGGRGASRADVLSALLELQTTGRDMTEELYFYFSGHGFAFEGTSGTSQDVLVTADFINKTLSGPSCFLLDEIVSWLQSFMGRGHHYHFIDACRNVVAPKAVQVAAQLPWDLQHSEEATIYVLQSTTPGAPALVAGPFAKDLVKGLRGAGIAKIWQPPMADAMLVKYESLRRFLKKRLATTQPITHRVAGEDGESDAVLAKIQPVPKYELTVNLHDALGSGAGSLILKGSMSPQERPHPFKHHSLVITLQPDLYFARMDLAGAPVSPAGEVQVELFDDATLEFTRLPGERGPGAAFPDGGSPGPAGSESFAPNLDVHVPDGTAFLVRNVSTGAQELFESSASVVLPRGTYAAKFSVRRGPTLVGQEFELLAGDRRELSSSAWAESVPHESIARLLPATRDGLEISESLGGAVADPDLNLWLALLGAGRILGPQGDYSKIADLPLADFSQVQEDASPLYVLAGFEEPATQLAAAISQDASIKWRAATEPAGMAGIRHAVFDPRPGAMLVSLTVGTMAPLTIASLASPNRCTLIVLTLDEEGVPRLSQFLLPLGHLVRYLPERVRKTLAVRNHLKDVRFLTQANRAFRRRRRLATEFHGDELGELLMAKWLDPVGAALAAYELLRRGDKEQLPEVVGNLKTYFSDLPDTAALARLAGDTGMQPAGVPLFLDGLRAFPDFAKWLPLPAGHLDFSASWTTWQAAVEAPQLGDDAPDDLAGSRGTPAAGRRRRGAARVQRAGHPARQAD
jgi:hypothetical protein